MDEKLQRYARELTRRDKALSYSTKYERYWHKRLSDRVERRVLAEAIRMTGPPHETILDMPCGAGRLTRELAPHGKRVFAADYSLEQIRICRDSTRGCRLGALRVNCFQLPFPDRSFDLVSSVRLSHHIADEKDRVRYLRELLRISRGCVIASFFDSQSLKNRLRELRRRLRKAKRAKYSMSYAALAAIAEEEGFRIVAALPLSRLFSGHRFYVFARTTREVEPTALAAGIASRPRA